MKTLKLTLQPQTAFATPLKGDTLFGQLCWIICHQWGEAKLEALLQNYHKQPFLIVSDAFPSGYLPRPQLPALLGGQNNQDASTRKQQKKQIWLTWEDFAADVQQWPQRAKTDKQLINSLTGMQQHSTLLKHEQQPHNSIHRLSGTTGGAQFAPYQLPQNWYHPEISLDIYLLLDEQQMQREQLEQALYFCGHSGYGKEANIGLGKFAIKTIQEAQLPHQKNANAWLTLAPCCPQGLNWQEKFCFYQPFTRFGRHGDRLAVSGKPFKNPILMAQTAAVLMPANFSPALYTGQAIGGKDQLLSLIQDNTRHQGYAPVIQIHLNTSV